jgi:two-component system chemotaxis response regulator CheB
VTPGAVIRVLIVDDSALVRQMLTEILGGDPELRVVGTAGDPYAAREQIKALSPDVITLDVEMPRMDGLTFLRNLMRLRPMPVVMISSLTTHGADAALDALALGAFDVVAKPKIDLATLADDAAAIVAKVKAAARAPVRAGMALAAPPRKASHLATTDQVIAIGASTGGTEAIARLLAQLPADCPGIVIAQHIPPEFSRRFAERLDGGSALSVREATDGDHILLGHAYVAPGQRHLRVVRSGARYLCRLGDDPPINRHRPSVDALFASVAAEAGRNAIGVILTGMGADGANGLGEIRASGGATIAQDQESSLIWGMPGEAVKRGSAEEIRSLDEIPSRLTQLTRRRLSESG